MIELALAPQVFERSVCFKLIIKTQNKIIGAILQ